MVMQMIESRARRYQTLWSVTESPVPAAIVLLALAGLFWATSHLQWRPKVGLVPTVPRVVAGDEPHYLLVVNSLLRDRNLFLEDDYRRVRMGGVDAGLVWRGHHLDHHTFLVDRLTHRAARWHEAYDWSRPVTCMAGDCVGFDLRLPEFAPGVGVYEVSSHPFAFPAVVAALLLPFSLTPEAVESRAIDVVSLFAWLACVFTYLVGRRSGMPRPWALAAALLTGVASPMLAYGRSFFPEAVAAFAVIAGLWAMQSDCSVLAGVACAVALAIKPPFCVVAVGFCAERVWGGRFRSAAVIGGMTALAAIVLGTLNFFLARTPLIAGTAPWRWADGLGPLLATLLGNQHGLFVFVPWTLLLFVIGVRARPSLEPPANPSQALLRQITLPLLLNMLLLALRADSPGYCWGPRYWVAFMPFLALATVEIARQQDRRFAWTLLALALLSSIISLGGAVGYSHVFGRGPESLFF